jgi:hypothetical protein
MVNSWVTPCFRNIATKEFWPLRDTVGRFIVPKDASVWDML